MSLAACSLSEVQQKLDAPYRQAPFIPDGLARVVVDDQRVRWQVSERRVYAGVGDSVDLWLQRAEPDAPFGEAVFTGLVPSCFGRALWITNQKTGAQEGACYLRRFTVQGGEALFQLRLGGDWVTALAVPLAEIYGDDDGDGLSNALERTLGTRLDTPDSDGDGRPDDQDGNPLVVDTAPLDQSNDVEGALVLAALSTSKACVPDKPLFVVGPDRLRRSFPGLPCRILWRAPTELSTAARTAASGVSDTERNNSGSGKLAIDLAAREGGIGRVLVDTDLSTREQPVVVLGHLLGEERVVFSHGDDGWVPLKHLFSVRGTTPATTD
ncbi:MAG: hypothetical protein ABIJ09_04715 [Pseudomonadota bacterium]